MKGYLEIQRRLDSLQMRTDLTIGLKNETWEFRGLNSPYISHQSVTLKEGHGVSGLVNFGEGSLFVCPRSFEGETWTPQLKGQFIARNLPAFHFAGLFKFPATCPSWLLPSKGESATGAYPIVTVFYPDRFSGYGDDGRPLFEGDPDLCVIVDGVEYDLVVSKLANFWRSGDTKSGKIACQTIAVNMRLRQVGFKGSAVNGVYDFGESFPCYYSYIDGREAEIDALLTKLSYSALVYKCGENCPSHGDCKICPVIGIWKVEEVTKHENRI